MLIKYHEKQNITQTIQFNVVVQAGEVPIVLDAQLRSVHPKQLKNERYGVGRSEIENA